MLKSLFSGVSGLQSHQVAMDVESNNIANVNTTGFKYSRANFSDLLAQTRAISTAPQGELGGKNAVQIGLGSTIGSMTRIFSQGSVQNSDKNTDMAIQGDGFFIISPDGGNNYKYTRSGDFKFDAGGNFVDNNGFIAQGWLRDGTTGKVDSTAPITSINIAPGLTTPANPSGEVVLKANLNSGPLVESFSPAYEVPTGIPNSVTNPGEGDAIDSNGNAISSGNLGVMFNEVGEAFSLQKDQGIWVSFMNSSVTASAQVADSTGTNDELDITFTLDDGTTKRVTTAGSSGIETAAINAGRYLSAINAQSATTGVEASYDGVNNKLILTNTNGSTSASHNIRLTVGANDSSGLASVNDDTTAYRYQYDPAASSAISNQDKTFTSISDLRYAMEVQARSFNTVNPGTDVNSVANLGDGSNDALNITIGGIPVTVANSGIAQIAQTALDVDLKDGDTISATFNAISYSATFDASNTLLDTHDKVMTAMATAISGGAGITATFDGNLSITTTADNAGTAFTVDSDYAVVNGAPGTSVAGAGTDVANITAVAQAITKTMDRAVADTDTLSITVNGNPYSVLADIPTTHANPAAVYTALKTAVELVEPVTVGIAGDALTFTANTAGTAYTIGANLANDDNSGTGVVAVADSSSQANIVAQTQVAETVLTADLRDGDTVSVTINGSAYAVTYDSTNSLLDSHVEVMTALQDAINVDTSLTAVFDGTLTLTTSANVAGTAFTVNTDYAVSFSATGTASAGVGTDVANFFNSQDENGAAYASAINNAGILGVTASYDSVTDQLTLLNSESTIPSPVVVVTIAGQSGLVAGSLTAATLGDNDGVINENTIEVKINEQGKFEISNAGGSEDGDYDLNLKITSIIASGITENTKFTRNMEALNAVLPVAAGGVAFSQSFNAATHSSSIDIFDSLGSKHTLRMEFRKSALDTATGSTWDMTVSVPQPATIDTIAPTFEKTGSIRFNNDGSLSTYNPPNISFSGNNGSAPNQQVNLSFGTANAFDGMTSFDSRSSTSGISQDGFTGGDLVGIRIDQSGTLVGSFSNGRSFGLAQIAMAKFTNNEGLSTEGGSVYVQTANSGDPIIGTAATAGRGFIQSSALEASNVDLSRALTQLIIIQRGFQANGKTITTSDQLLQTLIGLKN